MQGGENNNLKSEIATVVVKKDWFFHILLFVLSFSETTTTVWQSCVNQDGARAMRGCPPVARAD